MENIKKLYEKLDVISMSEFDQLEGEFFMSFYRIPKEKLPTSIICFMEISTWWGSSYRSGVWTYYEVADIDNIQATTQYLKEAGSKELEEIYSYGVHDYQNPCYHGNYIYPDTWIKEAAIIDAWIFEHEQMIWEWQRNLLLDKKEVICSLFD